MDTRRPEWLDEEDGEEQVFRNVRRRRCGFPRNRGRRRVHRTQRERRNGRQNSQRQRRCECRRGRTGLLTLRLRAAIIRGCLGDLCRRCAVFGVVQRARAVTATLPPRFRRRLPSRAERNRILREDQCAHDRGEASRNQRHSPSLRLPTRICQIITNTLVAFHFSLVRKPAIELNSLRRLVAPFKLTTNQFELHSRCILTNSGE